jgi:hypothetical protein
MNVMCYWLGSKFCLLGNWLMGDAVHIPIGKIVTVDEFSSQTAFSDFSVLAVKNFALNEHAFAELYHKNIAFICNLDSATFQRFYDGLPYIYKGLFVFGV